MIRQRVTTRIITLLVITLILLGLWQTGSGVWIYVKARLAQVLLQRAWAGTLASEHNVKTLALGRYLASRQTHGAESGN